MLNPASHGYAGTSCWILNGSKKGLTVSVSKFLSLLLKTGNFKLATLRNFALEGAIIGGRGAYGFRATPVCISTVISK